MGKKSTEEKFQNGDECLFCELNGEAKCSIVNIYTVDEFLGVHLIVLEVRQPPRDVPSWHVGQTIKGLKKRGSPLANDQIWKIRGV